MRVPRQGGNAPTSSGANLVLTDFPDDRLDTVERQRFFDFSPDLLAILDAEGRFISTNPAWTRTLGWLPQELETTTLGELSHPDDREAARLAWTRLMEDGELASFEHRVRSRIGAYRTISWTARSANRLFYGIGRDVTEQRSLQRQLIQSQKMEAIGQLAGGLAHDFNNVLGTMVGFSELARERLPPEHPVRADLDFVLEAAARGQAVIRHLLGFSRRQPVEPRRVDLNKALGQIRRLLPPILGGCVAVEFYPAPEPAPVIVDPAQLDLIVLNLAANARDAMPRAGRLRLSITETVFDANYVRTHPGAQPGEYCTIGVEDNGVGMDRETLSRIFEPFFTTKPPGQGTGLGLSMVYGAVKQAGGYIWVESEPGTGTRIELHYPRAPLANDERVA
jgi:PAS domain S-box-containing protein